MVSASLVQDRLKLRSKPALGGTLAFAVLCISFASIAALLAGMAPLPLSIATVFLFAGPHNLLELQYALSRFPCRISRDVRGFFTTSVAGTILLVISYLAIVLAPITLIPVTDTIMLNAAQLWQGILFSWVAAIAIIRHRQKYLRSLPAWLGACGFLSALNVFDVASAGVAMAYLHPVIGLFVLDRELGIANQSWQKGFRRTLFVIPALIVAVCLLHKPGQGALDTLTTNIMLQAGASVLPDVSPDLLVAIHTFLELLHYGVWLLAIPIVTGMLARRTVPLTAHAPGRSARCKDPSPGALNSLMGIPGKLDRSNAPKAVALKAQRMKRLIALLVVFGSFAVVTLWICFSMDYAATRYFYFKLAILHVIAELPLLLRIL